MSNFYILLLIITITLTYSFQSFHQKQSSYVNSLLMSTKVQRNENFAKLQAGMNIDSVITINY